MVMRAVGVCLSFLLRTMLGWGFLGLVGFFSFPSWAFTPTGHAPTDQFLETLSFGEESSVEVGEFAQEEGTDRILLRDVSGRFTFDLQEFLAHFQMASPSQALEEKKKTQLSWHAQEIRLEEIRPGEESTLLMRRFEVSGLELNVDGTEKIAVERIASENMTIPTAASLKSGAMGTSLGGPRSFERFLMCMTAGSLCYEVLTLDQLRLNLSSLPAAEDIQIRQVSQAIRNAPGLGASYQKADPISVRSRIDDLSVNLEALTEQARAGLRTLGYEALVFSSLCSESWQPENGAYALDYCRFVAKDMFKLLLRGRVLGLTEQVLHSLMSPQKDPQQTAVLIIGMELAALEVSFTDDSLFRKSLALRAEKEGIPLEELKGKLKKNFQEFSGIAFGQTPFAQKLQEAVASFIDTPKTLTLIARPQTPVSIAQIGGAIAVNPNLIPQLLNLEISTKSVLPQEVESDAAPTHSPSGPVLEETGKGTKEDIDAVSDPSSEGSSKEENAVGEVPSGTRDEAVETPQGK